MDEVLVFITEDKYTLLSANGAQTKAAICCDARHRCANKPLPDGFFGQRLAFCMGMGGYLLSCIPMYMPS